MQGRLHDVQLESSTPNMIATKTTTNKTVSARGRRPEAHSLMKAHSDPNLLLQSRRRTLQTVSELSPHTSSQSEWSDALPATTASSNSSTDRAGKRKSIGGSSSNQRPDRPKSVVFGRESRQPTILITEAPLLQHSFTAPMDQKQEETLKAQNGDVGSKSDRLFVRFSLGAKSGKDEATTSSESKRWPGPIASQPTRTSSQAKRTQAPARMPLPVRVQDGMGRSVPYGDTLRGKQHERLKMEKAVEEAKARREKGRISMGSSSTLPSRTPQPFIYPTTMSPAPARVRTSKSQQQLLQNSRTMNGGHTNRQAQKRHSQGPNEYGTNAQLLDRASMNSMTKVDSLTRSRSGNFNGTTSRLSTQNNAMPYSRDQSPTNYAFPRPPSEVINQDRMSRSTQRNQQTTKRNSSLQSTTTDGTNHSRKSSPARYRRTSRSHEERVKYQNGVPKEHLDALAALTSPAPPPHRGMTPESLALLESQQKILDEKIRRASVASDRASRISQIQQQKRSRAGSRVSHHSYGNDGSRAHKIGVNGQMTYDETIDSNNPEGLTPESVRLLREREKLVRWKAEREKVEFERKEREKIKERVRRANEMEEARSKEMEKEKQKKKRSGFCGLFGS